MRWLAVPIALCAMLAAATTAYAGMPDAGWVEPPSPVIWTRDDVFAAMAVSTPRVRCIVRSEIGSTGTNWDPYAVGDYRNGEPTSFGPAMLHVGGLLEDYDTWSGGASPYNPYRAIAYIEYMVAHGGAYNWHATREYGGWC